MYEEYEAFFAAPVSRQVQLRNFTWGAAADRARRGTGRFRITTRAADGEASMVEVDVTLEVTRQGEQLLIKRMYYQ